MFQEVVRDCAWMHGVNVILPPIARQAGQGYVTLG
jgi:hypothetical protein